MKKIIFLILIILIFLVVILILSNKFIRPEEDNYVGFLNQEEPAKKFYFHLPYNANYFSKPEEIKAACETLRRHLNLMNKYSIKTDYHFTWLAYKMTKENCPENLEILKDYGMYLEHHGANRDPKPQLIDRLKGKNWEEDIKIVRDYETSDIDPETGELLPMPGGLDQIKKEQGEIFSTGRFFKAPILEVTKEMGVKMAVGLKDNTGAPTNQAWFMGVLNRPESVGIGIDRWVNWSLGKALRGENLLDYLDEIIKSSQEDFSLGVITMHDYEFFRRRNFEEKEKIWRGYEAIVEHLVQNKKVRFLNLREIYNLTLNDREKTISREELSQAVNYFKENIKGNYLPAYLELENDYLSLTDFFQALVETIKYYDQNNILPAEVKTKDILGPTNLFYYNEVAALVSPSLEIEEFIKIISHLEIKDEIPVKVEIKTGQNLAVSDLLVGLVELYEELKENKQGKIEIPVNKFSLFPQGQENNDKVDDLTKLQFWTFKPVRFK